MKKFASYLIPSLIASVLMSMYAIVDGIFIGQKIGDAGLAAINITWPITSFLQSIGTAMGLSGGIVIQNLLGKKVGSEQNQNPHSHYSFNSRSFSWVTILCRRRAFASCSWCN